MGNPSSCEKAEHAIPSEDTKQNQVFVSQHQFWGRMLVCLCELIPAIYSPKMENQTMLGANSHILVANVASLVTTHTFLSTSPLARR